MQKLRPSYFSVNVYVVVPLFCQQIKKITIFTKFVGFLKIVVKLRLIIRKRSLKNN